mgnify:CR=1 FL=1
MSKHRIIKVTKMEAYRMGNCYTRIFRENEVAPEKIDLFNKLYKKQIYERRNQARRKKTNRKSNYS